MADIFSDRVGRLLDHVLSGVIDTFTAHGVDLPTRHVISVGTQPPHDCEQVTVTLQQIYYGVVGQPADQPVRVQGTDGPVTAVLDVQVVRTFPTITGSGRAPSEVKISEAARNQARDGWLLLMSIGDIDTWNTGILADVTFADPQGGFGGPVMIVTVPVGLGEPE